MTTPTPTRPGHTPEPWRMQRETHRTFGPEAKTRHTYPLYSEVPGKDFHCGEGSNEANADRIIACVNACKGFQIAWLEDQLRVHGPGVLHKFIQQAARDGKETAKEIGAEVSKALADRPDPAQLRASHDRLLAACKAATRAMGTHGPCEYNSCKECVRIWEQIHSAIAAAGEVES